MSGQQRIAAPPSPCIGVCRIDERSGYCLGCARTPEEIASWRTASTETTSRVWDKLPARRAALGLSLHRLAWTREDIRSFVAGTMRSNGGTWVGGVYGAVAEFCVGPDETVEVVDSQGSLVVTTPRAALRIHVSDRVRALTFANGGGVVLAVPRGAANPVIKRGLTAIGPDIDAVRPDDREGHLYDFGLGFGCSRFGVRVCEARLRQRLNNCIGYHWPELLGSAGREILQTSPPRVVVNPIGRIEVFTQIPPPGARTPPGPHTHFLPTLLASGCETPPRMELPEAYAACLIHYSAKSGIPNDPH
ncbi:MAG TPA: DUF1289 domain-containing protein [Roseiarcus sp.]